MLGGFPPTVHGGHGPSCLAQDHGLGSIEQVARQRATVLLGGALGKGKSKSSRDASRLSWPRPYVCTVVGNRTLCSSAMTSPARRGAAAIELSLEIDFPSTPTPTPALTRTRTPTHTHNVPHITGQPPWAASASGGGLQETSYVQPASDWADKHRPSDRPGRAKAPGGARGQAPRSHVPHTLSCRRTRSMTLARPLHRLHGLHRLHTSNMASAHTDTDTARKQPERAAHAPAPLGGDNSTRA